MFRDDEPAAKRNAGDFKEGEHPRAKDGQFTTGAGGGPLRTRPKGSGGPPKGQPMTPSPKAAKWMAAAVTEPDILGAPRIVTVSSMKVHEAIRTGKIKLAP
ncbi:MAG: hypothetical protein U0325_02655 [Polyangiales bacterium]